MRERQIESEYPRCSEPVRQLWSCYLFINITKCIALSCLLINPKKLSSLKAVLLVIQFVPLESCHVLC